MRAMVQRVAVLTVAALMALMALVAGPASAAYPGTNGKIVYKDESEHLLTMGGNGTGKTTLEDLSDDFGGLSAEAPSWAADGSRVTFTSFCCGGDSGTINVFSVGADGEGLTRHTFNTTDQNPEYDPLTNSLVFTSDADDDHDDSNDTRNIRSLNLGTGIETNLNPALTYDDAPTYSPDGSRIAFNRLGPTTHGIYTIDATGGNEQRLTFGSDQQADFSPSGASLAFARNDSGNYDGIYIAGADGGAPARLTSYQDDVGATYEDTEPSFSPDGKKVVFERTIEVGDTYVYDSDIWVVDLTTGVQTKLTTNGESHDPDWGVGVGTPPPGSPACSDGLDNDGDGKIDFPVDPGCSSPTDESEIDPATAPAGPEPGPAGPVQTDPTTDPLDRRAPNGSADPKGRSRAGGSITVEVSSDEAATVDVSGIQQSSGPASGKGRSARTALVRTKGVGEGSRFKVKLARARTQIEAGQTKKVTLKPQGKKNKKAAKKLKKAVKKGGKAKAKLKVVFTDEAGNREVEKLKLKLK